MHLATYSALLAARSITSVLAEIVDEKTAMQEFEARYRREYGVFYEFLVSFYEMHHSEDSYFWQAKKVTGNSQPELEAFVELIGGVSSGESALTDADALALRLQANTADFTTAVDALVANNSESMVPFMKSQVIRGVMHEGSQMQMRALLGEDAEPETPLFPGGLVSSADGMFWLPTDA
ncbi:Tryptophan halogenase [Frankia sp. Allo2]|nr:Tryptophan halogenase [Frankia sp. Allo2]